MMQIDGQAIYAIPGQNLLDALGQAGIEIPHVCYHPALGSSQICEYDL